ncbi:MAG: DUF2007 domain-containing protein [Acidobacteriota bacterium]
MRDDDLQLLATEYSAMTEAELLAAAADFNDMVEPAQRLLQAEFSRRSLTLLIPRIPPSYGKMSVRQLMQTARTYNQLPESDQALLRAEFKRRAILPPLLDDDGQPEPDSLDDDLTMVTVGRYRDLSEAIVARAVLEEAGIRCFLRDENTARLHWTWSNLIGGMRLDVPDKEAAAAAALLAEPTPASFPVDSGPDYTQPVCPSCGSIDVMTDNTGQKLAASGTLAYGILLPVVLPAMALQPDNVWKCNACGTRWQDDDQPAESETSA